MYRYLLLMVSLVYADAIGADNVRWSGIKEFKKQADLCEHLAGEWDNNLSKQRQREIERGVDKHCGKAQRQLQRLRKKFRIDSAMTAELEESANPSVWDYRK